MPRFLKTIASYYAVKGLPCDTAMVFANRRSALFMGHYMRLDVSRPVAMPRMMTMEALMAQLSGLDETPLLEQRFVLYDAYCEALEAAGRPGLAKPFERFVYWGDMLLDDFMDIDSQMVDTAQLFRSVDQYKEISATYLTDEQGRVARELFGFNPAGDTGRFWRHVPARGKKDKLDFTGLWNIMGDIYNRFTTKLLERGQGTRGMIARRAATVARGTDRWPWQRIVFIGQGILTRSQRTVMEAVGRAGLGHFFIEPMDAVMRDIRGTDPSTLDLVQYQRQLLADFPPPPGYSHPAPSDPPQVHIIGVPGNALQTKIAANVLTTLVNEGHVHTGRPDSTAVVLPDANLLVDMLHSLPEADPARGGRQLYNVNVTMGVPYRQTPFAGLLRAILNMIYRRSMTRGELTFIGEDVSRVISNPALIAADHSAVHALKDHMHRRRSYTYTATFLKDVPGAASLAFVFDVPTDGRDITAAQAYLDRLLDNLARLLGTNGKGAYEARIIDACRRTILNLEQLYAAHPRAGRDSGRASGNDYLHMIENLMWRERMAMYGSPLSGLQILGPLETRSIDFDNLVVLSMNERTFPPRNIMRSLIPGAIRAGFDMTTSRTREMEYARLFYRMLNRSRRVTLLYDARTSGMAAGEMSRYLVQLRHLFNGCNPTFTNITPHTTANARRTITVTKTTGVMDEIRRLSLPPDHPDALKLSASSLKDLKNCTLEFYLKRIHRLSADEDTTAYMDSATFGNVAHETLQYLYEKVTAVNGHNRITPADIDVMLAMPIEDKVLERINAAYYHGQFMPPYDRMPAEGTILGRIITRFINGVLENEKLRPPYEFVGAEVRVEGNADKPRQWQAAPGIKVNFTGFIDRLDRLDDGSLRFIDYKSGRDKLNIYSVDGLFDNHEKFNDAAFQLLTYAWVYTELHKLPHTPVIPEIVRLTASLSSPDTSVRYNIAPEGKKATYTPVTGHDLPWLIPFRNRLAGLIADLFDEKIPITQTQDEERCRYCKFLNLCGRTYIDRNG